MSRARSSLLLAIALYVQPIGCASGLVRVEPSGEERERAFVTAFQDASFASSTEPVLESILIVPTVDICPVDPCDETRMDTTIAVTFRVTFPDGGPGTITVAVARDTGQSYLTESIADELRP